MNRLFRFTGILLLTLAASVRAGEVPPLLAEVLKSFRADGTKGWSFTQTTTTTADKNLTERFDAEKPNFTRWSLLKKDGRDATADEIKTYKEKTVNRVSENGAPNIKDQLDMATCETVSDSPERGVYRFRLKPVDKEDKSAAFMAATFTLDKPTKTIEHVELANVEPFAPMFSVRIQEAKTVIDYSLPTAAQPTLLQKVVVRIRGRALWVKSLDEDMTVTYSDFAPPHGQVSATP